MTKIQILYFLESARQKNITHAASALFVSQQVVSRQIKKLEEEIGFPLFVRNGRQLELTEGGLLFYDFYDRVIRDEKKMFAQARSVMQVKDIMLKIGILNISRVYDWIAEASCVFEQAGIKCMLLTEIGSFNELFQKIISGQLDMIISLSDESEGLPSHIICRNICSSWPRIVISDRHPAYHENLKLEELKNSEIYMLSNRFSKHAMKNMMAHCKEIGLDMDNIIVFDDIASMEMALLNGKGFTIAYEQYFRNTTGHLKFLPAGEAEVYVENAFMIAYDMSKKDLIEPFVDYLVQMEM